MRKLDREDEIWEVIAYRAALAARVGGESAQGLFGMGNPENWNTRK